MAELHPGGSLGRIACALPSAQTPKLPAKHQAASMLPLQVLTAAEERERRLATAEEAGARQRRELQHEQSTAVAEAQAAVRRLQAECEHQLGLERGRGTELARQRKAAQDAQVCMIDHGGWYWIHLGLAQILSQGCKLFTTGMSSISAPDNGLVPKGSTPPMLVSCMPLRGLHQKPGWHITGCWHGPSLCHQMMAALCTCQQPPVAHLLQSCLCHPAGCIRSQGSPPGTGAGRPEGASAAHAPG